MKNTYIGNTTGMGAEVAPASHARGVAASDEMMGGHRPAKNRVRALGAAVAAVAAAWLAVGCGGGSGGYDIPPEAMVARPSSTLSVGDVVRVSYTGAPELNQKQKINVNGQISLPMIGNVTASGRTPGSLQSSLTAQYEPHLQVPDVQVALDTPAAVVYVVGEVRSPGKVPLDRSMSAFEAIMESGGFSPLANPKKVIVVRNEKGKERRFVLNLGDTLTGTETQAFYLRPFDTIYVKRSNW